MAWRLKKKRKKRKKRFLNFLKRKEAKKDLKTLYWWNVDEKNIETTQYTIVYKRVALVSLEKESQRWIKKNGSIWYLQYRRM